MSVDDKKNVSNKDRESSRRQDCEIKKLNIGHLK